MPISSAFKISKSLKELGYLSVDIGIYDTSLKLFHENISNLHGATTVALTAGLFVAGVVASGGIVLVIIGAGLAYSLLEDRIWESYDKKNVENYINSAQ